MTTRNILIGSLIAAGLIVIIGAINTPLMKAANYVGTNNGALSWLVFIIFLGLGVCIFVTRPRTLGNTGLAVSLAGGNWLFLVRIYYGSIHNWIIREYGYDPRFVLLIQTALVIVAAGIIYYFALYVFEEKPNAWKAYTLISVFGSLVIALGIWSHPYDLFKHHPTNVDGTVAVNQQGKFAVQAKVWILRDANTGKIIDYSSSPGISSIYGMQFVPIEPKDVQEFMEFKAKNSGVPFFSNKKDDSENKNGGTCLREPALIHSEILEMKKAGDERMTKMSFARGDRIQLTVISGHLAHLIKNKEVEWFGKGTFWTTSNGGIQVFRAKTPNARAHINVWALPN